VAEQGVRGAAVRREERCPDFARDPKHAVIQMEGMLREIPCCFFYEPYQVADLLDIHQHDGKLVRTHSRHQACVARAVLKQRCDLLQKRVASRLAERIVDIFESLEIEQVDGNLTSRAGGNAHALGYPFKEQSTVRQSG